MNNASTINAGNSPAPIPIEFLILGDKVMIKRKGVLIVVSLADADPAQSSGTCRGCGCLVAVRASK